jgi:hypothetical protein
VLQNEPGCPKYKRTAADGSQQSPQAQALITNTTDPYGQSLIIEAGLPTANANLVQNKRGSFDSLFEIDRHPDIERLPGEPTAEVHDFRKMEVRMPLKHNR